ncbi:MAG TPA: hypothetical protein VFG42_25990 [Baekduia sp.]|uniref:hypothetical protein n=1 Tax=Baekduia sp. TaxID=2600305 RepID=UPI002D76A86C|nr:hypothetical protein [Baekduia sp.]HET6510271.1 hypothetical protein [Baekduia sp.]
MGRSSVEIRIRGRLDDDGLRRLQDAFGRLSIAQTVMVGDVADQAELQAALALLRDAGAQVVEVRRVGGHGGHGGGGR